MQNNQITTLDNTKKILTNLLDDLKDGYGKSIELNINQARDKATIKISDEHQCTTIIVKQHGSYKENTQITVQKPISKEERQELVYELYKKGRTQAEIAKLVDVSQKTISNDLKHKKLQKGNK